TAGGAVSGGIDPFFGLGDRLPDQAPLDEKPPKDHCLALFGPQGWGEELPIAIFSDFNCPYCKVLEQRLMDLRDSGAPVRLIWHELPLLGPSSVRYARAVLAARFLGAEARARAYLKTHVLRPGEDALGEMALALDLLPDMLIREFNGARVSIALAESMALGGRLGIPGTPGTVIGRTLVVGAISEADLKALIALEQSEPRTLCA
ncbi:MAG: DsbA family protein, partial [Roseobacter sp.]|nr:DsbA family protein [Roseobacter sp.]